MPSPSTTDQDGNLGRAAEEFKECSSKTFRLIGEIRLLDEKIARVDKAVVRKTGELVRDPYYQALTNERDRKAFIEEYLDYDDLIESKLMLSADRDYALRVLAVHMLNLTRLSHAR